MNKEKGKKNYEMSKKKCKLERISFISFYAIRVILVIFKGRII